MGFTKRMMEQQWAQGWNFTNLYVCPMCVDEVHMAAAIALSTDADQACDFCGTRPAAPLDVLMAAFVGGVRNAYGTADDEGVAWDGREGGTKQHRRWTLGIWSTTSWAISFSPQLCKMLLVIRWLTPHGLKGLYVAASRRGLIESWAEFCETVKYQVRYVLWLRKDYDPDERWQTGEIPPALILDEIGRVIEKLGFLIRTLPTGYSMWRARAHKTANGYELASDLGTAPRQFARANRMSPAGIGLFYGAADTETAMAEIGYVDQEHKWITVGEFANLETNRCNRLYESARGREHVPPRFRRPVSANAISLSLRRRIKKPATEAQQQPIDYVPTQIITEYLLRVFESKRPIEGILYSSAVNGHTCLVIDVSNDCCCDRAGLDGRKRTSSWT